MPTICSFHAEAVVAEMNAALTRGCQEAPWLGRLKLRDRPDEREHGVASSTEVEFLHSGRPVSCGVTTSRAQPGAIHFTVLLPSRILRILE
jgi:hypothetical protein